MQIRFKKIYLVLATVFCCQFTQAQNYPYEDNPDEENTEKKNLPTEAPEDVDSPKARLIRKNKARTSWAAKGGVNYSLSQQPSILNAKNTLTTKGMGFDAVISYGADLAHQPIFLEFESGYRMQFMAEADKLHVIPLRFGTFYRQRIGDTSVWRPGIVAGLNYRLAKNDLDEFEWALVPSIGISSTWDLSHFVVEFVMNINRLEKQYNFFDFSARVGFRF